MTTTTEVQAQLPTQYGPRTVLGLWLAAAGPMGLLAWVVAPALAGRHPDPSRFVVCLIAALTVGLAWQFVLVLVMVRREGGNFREALWLGPPRAKRRTGGRLWWWALAALLAIAVVEALPLDPPGPASRDFGAFLGTGAGHDLMRGNWALFGLCVVMFVLNTVLGEELFFRGLLLPRMEKAFGSRAGLVNGVLFGLYHLHQPWSIPGAAVGGVIQAVAVQRWRSAWLGIIAHSGQSLFFTILLLKLVVS